MYAHVPGKLRLCSAREEQHNWAVWNPIYMSVLDANVMPARASILVFVTVCVSVFCVWGASCWEYVWPLLQSESTKGSINPVLVKQNNPSELAELLLLTSLNKPAC